MVQSQGLEGQAARHGERFPGLGKIYGWDWKPNDHGDIKWADVILDEFRSVRDGYYDIDPENF